MKFPFLGSTRAFAHTGVAVTLLIGLIGCGGGGGGGSNNSDNSASTKVNTTGDCDEKTYTPNYATKVPLLHWTGFPLHVFFVQDDQYSVSRQVRTLAGFNRWVAATGSRANFTVVDTADAADFTVSFYKFTGGAGDILGTTTVSYDSSGTILSTTMQIGITGETANDIVVDTETAAHEYGHNLGISGHSPNSADLMYFTGNASGAVTTSDLNTLKTAYCDTFPARSTLRKAQSVGKVNTIVIHDTLDELRGKH